MILTHLIRLRFDNTRLTNGAERWHFTHVFIPETIETATETAAETTSKAATKATTEARSMLETSRRLRFKRRCPSRSGLAGTLVLDTLRNRECVSDHTGR